MKESIPHDSVFIGALSLDGTVEKVEGMLPALMAAKSIGFKKVYIPYDSLIPFDMFEGLECIVIEHINDVLQHFIRARNASPCATPASTGNFCRSICISKGFS